MLDDGKEVELCELGARILRAQSQKIASMPQAVKICSILIHKLRELQGAGLAAPQIGLPYRVFVVEVRKNVLFPLREETPLFNVINPELEVLSQEEELDYEACFSIPGYLGLVPRFRKIRLKWTDLPGSLAREEVFEGYIARVIQHEMDHLNGLVYLDRMQDMNSLCTREHYMRELMESQRMTLRVMDERN